jgi:hypothetical protein
LKDNSLFHVIEKADKYLGVALGVLWLNEAERLREGERPGEGVPSGTPQVGGEAAEKANSDSDLLKGLKIQEKRL